MVGSCFEVHAPARLDCWGGYSDVPQIHELLGTAIVNIAVDLFEDPLRAKPVAVGARLAGDATSSNAISATQGTYGSNVGYIQGSGHAIVNVCGLPMSTGLGLSGSLAVARSAVECLARGRQIPRRRRWIIKSAMSYERDVLGVVGGYQDYVSAANGGCHVITQGRRGATHILRVRTPGDLRHFLDSWVCIVHSRRPATSSDILKDLLTRLGDKIVVKHLERIRDINQAAARLLQTPRFDFKALAGLVNASSEARRQVSPMASNSVLIQLEERIRPFVWCTHECGAGGASLAIFSKPSAARAVERAIEQAQVTDPLLCWYPRTSDAGVRSVNVSAVCS
ncbi:MAG: hypothetical protein M3O61_15060 [Gemmatimonadota bacterium]|nr:hypothetical protein [Gemmatimonadota bacterium]